MYLVVWYVLSGVRRTKKVLEDKEQVDNTAHLRRSDPVTTPSERIILQNIFIFPEGWPRTAKKEPLGDGGSPPFGDVERHFIVQLSGGPLNPGERVTVRCRLSSLPQPIGPNATAKLDPDVPHVTFVCHVEGFRLLTDLQITVNITLKIETKDVAFLLEVTNSRTHRITITAYQGGVVRGQVVIPDPGLYLDTSSVRPGPATEPGMQAADSVVGPWRQPNLDPSLSLDLSSPMAPIIANSPRDKLNWGGRRLEWLKPPDKIFELVRDHVSGLYKSKLDVEYES